MRSYQEAILEALDQILMTYEKSYLIGLGVPDPKGIFNTTIGLQQKYGDKRVMDMPVSENAMMGVAIGSSILGMRPIMTHQRVDFFLLALDQLINNAAKWHYMFAGKMKVPVVIRLIIGRGWGQGPQHSQTLHSFFAHIPGLKVVMPSRPYDAKGLLISAVEDDNPVIFIEHRWLHGTIGEVPKEIYKVPLGKAYIVQEGDDVTVVAFSHMVVESVRAAQKIRDRVSVEIIDGRCLRPLDEETIISSVKKTKRLVVVDPDWKIAGMSSEIIALVAEHGCELKSPPIRITYPEMPSPTSWALANYFYPTINDIVGSILQTCGKSRMSEERQSVPLDVPDSSFKGPF
jgi:acetoin:2,6-dichlorophenolindophenol oxidoreductase subunit beta